MRIISKPMACGKTYEAIKRASEIGATMVCMNKEHCYRVVEMAEKMGCKIPFPITFSELKCHSYYGKGIKTIIIDDADLLLQSLCPDVEIDTITLTGGSSTNVK